MGASQSSQSKKTNKKTAVLAQRLRRDGHKCVTIHPGQTARVLWCGNWDRCTHT